MKKLKIKRVYDAVSRDDGIRILVDRLWPRGLTKSEAHITIWLKEIGPSNELRKAFNHDPEKWPEFKKHYLQELHSKKELIEIIAEKLATHNVTLLYSAKDEKYNNAVVLQTYLEKHL